MEFVLPKDNPYLIGQEKAEKCFLEAVKSNSLHHAFLISGIQGIGKATFAYKIARFLLQENFENAPKNKLDIPPSDPVFRQISGGSNPNFLAIERDYTETDKKKIIKAIREGEPLEGDDLQGLKKSSVIKVDEIREINQFLSKKSFEGAWRVVLIDSIDELNIAASNAILKILEEPPLKTILLLISHQPSKLLPTIKSRCAKLILEPLSQENIASLLRRYMPNLVEKDVKALSEISGGSIGRALNYALNNGLDLYSKLQNIVFAGSNFDIGNAIDLASLGGADENIFSLEIELILKILSDMLLSGEKTEDFYEIYNFVSNMNRDVVSLNMDKKHALLNTFYQISKVVSNAY